MLRPRKKTVSSILKRTKTDGTVVYEAYLGLADDGRPVRISRTSRAALLDEIDARYARDGSAESVIARPLTEAQLLDARMALSALSETSCGLTLTECVRRVVEDLPACDRGESVPAGEAYDVYLAHFAADQTEHVATVRTRVGRLVDSFGRDRPVRDLSAAYIRDWIDGRRIEDYGGRTCSPKTWNNYVGYISAFMSWCVDEGYLGRNPVEREKSLRKRTIRWKEPEFIRAETAATLMQLLWEHEDRSMLAFAVLSLFCGTRTCEIVRLADAGGRNRISVEDGVCRIVTVKGETKGFKPRCFAIPATALAWMRAFPFAEWLSRVHAHTVDNMRSFAADRGLVLPKNCGRKTFCTMHTAKYNDPNALGAIVGNTEDVRDATYRGLASPKEAEAYFAVMPPEPL